MEMWNNWKNDIKTLQDEFQLGTVMNAGIGGSVASHWYRFKDSLVAYGAKKGIYMIGINDLTGGTSPASVVASIKNTLLYVKDAIPEYEVVLLSVNHCPARNQIRTQISETNVLMQKLAAQYDWIYYAEVEYAFCDNGSTPDNHWFIDGLHPSSAGYKQKLIPAIQSALRGENQPTLDDNMNAQLLESAKSVRYCQLTDFGELAFRAEEWKTAKPIYEAAVAAIEACKTPDEVDKLDLSSYIEQLSQIKNVGDYSYEELLSGENCDKWETDVFKNALESGKDGSFTLTHDGHRLNNNTLYTDMTFKFKLGDVKGNFDVAGPLFHASQSDALGIQGYMINIVTEPNYLQVWYFEECFGTANKNMHYIGGWVFPDEVEDTEFRAVIEGNMIYLYTEEDYQTKGKDAYGCSVDLSNNGQLKPYEYGAYGILCWNSNTGAKGDMIISDLQGTPYQP
jgi:lysophospholipase L1-like esterase